jgi:Double zinc ribbon
MSVPEERRCPNCGALVSPDAEWCGQCFTSLRTVAEPGGRIETGPVRVTREGPEGARPTASWTCPACEHENALELDLCEVCGTSFGALLRQDEERRSVDPWTAARKSLLLPGLGHAAVGRAPDGIARGVLFAWTFGTAIVILLAGLSSGPAAGLLALYGGLAIALYAFTAFEAYRVAEGSGLLVSSRVLLWGAVALVLASALMAAFLILSAGRR